ncbi:hypothetical protein BGAL_0561g00010 [Botrytis galanthina]|uniref:Uncharacterized protein n=1 Tax=Botrytis galanthina TaxID=278940 RepID=A0A4S8QP05_9HELO|nr:hypothetical protein BGAL_0561g00010 [Botrytis galanthina]
MPRTTRASAAAGGSKSAEIPLENQVDQPQIEMESIPPPKRRGRPPCAESVIDKNGDRDNGTSKVQSDGSSKKKGTDAGEAADAMEGARDREATEAEEGTGAPKVAETENETSRVPWAKKSIQIEISESEEMETDGTDSDGLPEDPLSAGLKIAPLKKAANWKGKGKSKADEEFDDIDGSSDSNQDSNRSPESTLPVRSKLPKVSKGKEIDLHHDEEMPDIDQAADDDSDSEPPEWTDDEQILLDATYPQELALWWRCKEIFDCAPQDLFPIGVKASNGHWDGYHCKDQDRYIKNDTCLTVSFCATLSELICFPYFRKNKEYVQYALSSAIKARCGDKAPFDMLEGYNPWVNWDKKFKQVIKHLQDSEIYFDKKQTRIVEGVLSMHFVGDFPPFSEFLAMPRLQKIAKQSRAVKETYDSNHLMNIDLQNIIKAWDSYNQEGGLNLLSIKASRDVYDKQHGRAKHGTRAKILGWKKAWILQKRQKDREEAARSKSRNFSSSPLLGDSAASDDPFIDSVEKDQSPTQIRSPVTQDPSSSKGNLISNFDPRDYEDNGDSMGGDGMPSDDEFELQPCDLPAAPPADSLADPDVMMGGVDRGSDDDSEFQLCDLPADPMTTSPAYPLTDSQEEFVVDDSHKADVQGVLDSTQKVISQNILDQTPDILVRNDVERTSILVVQAYDMFSDDDDEVPRHEESAGLQFVDTNLVAVNISEEMLDLDLVDNENDAIYSSIRNLATMVSDSPIFADECIGAECLHREGGEWKGT